MALAGEAGARAQGATTSLQRQEAEVSGDRSRNIAGIARAEQNINETRLRVDSLRTDNLNDATQQLRQTQNDLFDLREQVRAAEDVLARTSIRAPQDGIVVGLQVHTVGGVVTAGQTVMNIVPSGDQLVVEARVDPSDIDEVRPGLDARIRLTAYTQRNFVPINGRVTSVSADRLTDDKTNAAYYKARVVVTDDPVKVMRATPLYPGMQAEVMIVTGERTMLDYFFRPLINSFHRAFRES